MRKILLIVVAGTLVFQLLHFTEHGVQLYMWFNGFREMPYMTLWATDLAWWLGEWMLPSEEDWHRVFHVGVELLHLVGNAIFMVGCLGLWYILKNKLSKWACVFQGIHLYEHISLFFSAYYLHKSVGMSTLYGYFQPYGTDLYAQQSLTTFRVWWHFMANLIPTVLVIMALWYGWKKIKTYL